MALATAQKLKLKEGNTIFAINAPAHYDNALGSLPKGAKITDTAKTPDQVHWFVKNKAQMEKDLKSVLSLLKDQAICWIFFPKGSSKIQTDLTRDSAWALLQNREVQMITLISFDDIWSAFGVRQKIQTEKKKEQKAKINPVLD